MNLGHTDICNSVGVSSWSGLDHSSSFFLLLQFRWCLLQPNANLAFGFWVWCPTSDEELFCMGPFFVLILAAAEL